MDFKEGSITLDFAKEAGAAVSTYERSHVEDMAAWADYSVVDDGLYSAALEVANLLVLIRSIAVTQDTLGCDSVIGIPDILSRLKFKNNIGAANNLVVMRHHLSTATYETNYSVDIAAGASYTPADEGLFSHSGEGGDIYCEYKYNAAWWHWRSDIAAQIGTYLGIGDGTNLRYHNVDGANANQANIVRSIMVT